MNAPNQKINRVNARRLFFYANLNAFSFAYGQIRRIGGEEETEEEKRNRIGEQNEVIVRNWSARERYTRTQYSNKY